MRLLTGAFLVSYLSSCRRVSRTWACLFIAVNHGVRDLKNLRRHDEVACKVMVHTLTFLLRYMCGADICFESDSSSPCPERHIVHKANCSIFSTTSDSPRFCAFRVASMITHTPAQYLKLPPSRTFQRKVKSLVGNEPLGGTNRDLVKGAWFL